MKKKSLILKWIWCAVPLVMAALMYFVLPAVISLFFSGIMRKMKIIKAGDLKLDL